MSPVRILPENGLGTYFEESGKGIRQWDMEGEV